jgi:hypothetical protein
MVFRADTGERLLDLLTGLSQMGPPMTFMIDGKQYVVVAGGPAQAGGRGGQGGGQGKQEKQAGPPARSRLLALVLDGTTPLPGVPPSAPAPAK